MKLVIKNINHSAQAFEDKEYWRAQTPEATLDAVERLQLGQISLMLKSFLDFI